MKQTFRLVFQLFFFVPSVGLSAWWDFTENEVLELLNSNSAVFSASYSFSADGCTLEESHLQSDGTRFSSHYPLKKISIYVSHVGGDTGYGLATDCQSGRKCMKSNDRSNWYTNESYIGFTKNQGLLNEVAGLLNTIKESCD